MKPVRDPEYRKFIASLPCCVCHSTRRIEAAHTGPHGMAQKSSDLSCIPLCSKHHRTGNDSLHKLGPFEFSTRHQIDIPELLRELNRFTDGQPETRNSATIQLRKLAMKLEKAS